MKPIESNTKKSEFLILVILIFIILIGCSRNDKKSYYFQKSDLNGKVLGFRKVISQETENGMKIDSIFEYKKDFELKDIKVSKYRIKNNTLSKFIENCKSKSYFVEYLSAIPDSCITFHQQCLSTNQFDLKNCYLGNEYIKVGGEKIKTYHFKRYDGIPVRMEVHSYYDFNFQLILEVFDEGSDYNLPNYRIERLSKAPDGL